VVTGRIERGIVKVGEEIEIVGISVTQKTTWHGRGKCSASCSTRVKPATTSVSCCAAPSVKTSSVARVLCKPNSVKPHTHFTGEIYVLSKDEGGRHTPFFNNYRPQFYFRTTDVTGAIELPKDKEMVMPGDKRVDHGQADRADRDGRRPALRHP